LQISLSSHQVYEPGERKWIGYLYILPGFLVYALFILWPIVNTFHLSLYEWDGITPAKFIGLQNFSLLIDDEVFRISLRNNLLLIPFYTFLPIGFSLLLTVLITRHQLRGLSFFRVGLFIPYVMSMVVVGVVWQWIYNPVFGPLNQILREVGLGAWARPWLGDHTVALPALGLVGAWVQYGFSMALFIAGVQHISEELYDAARIDGAGEIQQLLHITLPGLRNELTVVLLANFITSIRVFDLVFVTTRGGPGNQTMVVNFWLYRNAFAYSRTGYAAAIAVIMTVVIMIVSTFLILVRQRSVEEV
jgi:raffinose/stachyose/melibiose transport system permease protein